MSYRSFLPEGTPYNGLYMMEASPERGTFFVTTRFWETAHLPLPLANINTYFSLKAKCLLRGGVGGQFTRNI